MVAKVFKVYYYVKQTLFVDLYYYNVYYYTAPEGEAKHYLDIAVTITVI